MALVIAGTDFIQMPSGTTAQRPASPAQGMQRYNTTLGYTEIYDGSAWVGAGTQGATAPAALSTASGSAPSYSARAWVNFNGTGTVAIRASGNVSSITDNGTGDFTINFTTAMPDVNYAFTAATNSWSTGDPGGINNIKLQTNGSSSSNGTPTLLSTTQCRVLGGGGGGQLFDSVYMYLSFFR
jgi:hypothetical protein